MDRVRPLRCLRYFWQSAAMIGMFCAVIISPSNLPARLPTIHATEVTALVKGVAELPCDVTSPDPNDPVRLVLWYRAESSTPIYSVDTRDSDFGAAEHWSGDILGQRASFRSDRHLAALVIANVKAKDEGLYRCRVDFRLAQTRNAHVNLTVVVPPRRPSIVAKEGQLSALATLAPLELGQPLSLSCETTGGKPLPRLIWWRDGRIVDDTYVKAFDDTVRNDLWIPSLGRQDLDAVLTCEASNSNLTLALSTSVQIDLILPVLSVHLSGADQPLSAGKEVTISCAVRGSRPAPIITWFLDERILSESVAQPASAGWNETKSVIRFVPGVEDRGKKLTCRARNVNTSRSAAAAHDSPPVLDPAHVPDPSVEDARRIVVHARPEVALSLGSNLQANNIKEGDDVYFDCRASAQPPVTRLEWYHNDKKLGHNISAGVIITNQSLVLQRVGRHSAGRYRCTAMNREGDTESQVFHLDVKYAPFCRPGQHRLFGVARHEEARISCDVDANPATGLHFRWLFNSSAGVIELPGATWSADGTRSLARYLPSSDLDFGSLLCSAHNAIGHQAVPCVYHIIPADKPDPVTNCSVSHQSAESLQIACSEGFSGGIQQKFVLEIFAIDSAGADGASGGSGGGGGAISASSAANQTSARPVFTVRGLHPDTVYVAHVTAENAKGRSEPLVVRIVTLRPPETQKNIGPGKTDVDMPRPQPSSSGQISPLVAIIAGAVSAVVLLSALLAVALRLHCRRAHLRAAHAAAAVMSASGTCHRGSETGAASAAGSETLLLVKSEQIRSTTPVFGSAGSTDADDRNPDLIPVHEDEELLQAAMMMKAAAAEGAPLAALLTDLPPHHFYARQLGVSTMQGSSATLGRPKGRWARTGAEPDDFVSQSLMHVTSTLPRPPRPPWTANPTSGIIQPPQRFAALLSPAPAGPNKKESSV